MALKNGTICSKHDKVLHLTIEIERQLDDILYTIERDKYFDYTAKDIKSNLNEIYGLISDALDDGKNMERGLIDKKNIIQEYEKQINKLEEENANLWRDYEELKRKLMEIENGNNKV